MKPPICGSILWFYYRALDLGPNDILLELDRRFGQSGIEEKAGRS